MKSIHILLIGLGILIFLVAQEAMPQFGPSFDVVKTKAVDGFVIGVTDEQGQTNSPVTRRLLFSVWTTNSAWIDKATVEYPNTKYLCQIALLNQSGVAVPKTKAGEAVGSRFLHFDPNHVHIYGTGPPQPGILVKAQYMETNSAYCSNGLFKSSEVFKIDKPGHYTLQIRFQIIAFIPKANEKGRERRLIRFPTLNYSLVKE